MPSFALNQEIVNLEEQQMNGDTTVAARLKVCYAQRTEESAVAASAAEKKVAAAAALEAKQMKKMRGGGGGGGGEAKEVHSGSLLNCRDCETDFFFSDKENAFFTEKGLSAPTRCYPCRQEKKAQRQGPQTMHIACSDCHTDFVHSIGAQQHYEENGWSAPVRCVPCRTAKKAKKLAAFPINCKDCHTDFIFPVGSQIYFKEQKWDAPSRCAGCRKTNKVKVAAEAEKAALVEVVAAAFAEGAAPAASEVEDGPELDQDDRNKEHVSMMRND